MKFCLENTYILHSLLRNIMHSAIKTRKTNKKKENFEMWRGSGKKQFKAV